MPQLFVDLTFSLLQLCSVCAAWSADTGQFVDVGTCDYGIYREL